MIKSCFGFTTASSQDPSSCHSLATSGIEERVGKVKAGKLMGWDKGSLMGKAKESSQAKKNK